MDCKFGEYRYKGWFYTARFDSDGSIYIWTPRSNYWKRMETRDTNYINWKRHIKRKK